MSTFLEGKYLLYIHLSNVDFGSYQAKPNDSFVIYAGSQKNLHKFPLNFNLANKNKIMEHWTFQVLNPETCNVIFTVYRKRLFGEVQLVGDLNLRVFNFEGNRVVSQSFNLNSRMSLQVQPSICLDVHLDNQGSTPFYAPPGRFLGDYEDNLSIHN